MIDLPIYLIDDDTQVLEALSFLLNTAGYRPQCWSNAIQFLDEVDLSMPAVVVTDINMPYCDGKQLQKKINAINSPIGLIVLTGYGEVSLAVEMLKEGVVDFIEKPVSLERLQKSIHDAAQKALHQADALYYQKCFEKLSLKEQCAAELIVNGYTNKVIAEMMHVSVRTVEVYRANIMQKMEASHLPELVKKLEGCIREEE